MNNWISVEDKLPDENKMVIVCANDIVSEWLDVACYYICPEYLTGGWCDDDGEPYAPIVTRWMPLHEPTAIATNKV